MNGPHIARTHRQRILLTGATGQVGWELSSALRTLGDVVAPQRIAKTHAHALDLALPESIRAAVREIQPHLIVNAAAYTAVDQAEEEADLAMAVNGTAPGVLAAEADRLGAALVHYSTDYVFDGGGTRPWREDDPTGPLNVYGQTKLAGEAAIRASGVPHLIIRTSWVYGVHGDNFVKTMLRLAAEREDLRIVSDQFGAPTSARFLAEATTHILGELLRQIHRQATADFAGLLREHGGTVHLACRGETTWYDFAGEIFRQARSHGRRLSVREVVPISSEAYPTPARRPRNSRLDCSRLDERFGPQRPDWKAALAACLEDIFRPTNSQPSTDPGRIKIHRPGWDGAPTIPFRESAAPSDLDLGVIYTHEREWMPPLLSSMVRSGDGLGLRLILVDNASKDGIDPWKPYFPQTTVVRNTKRLGYAANLNRILEASTAPLVLLLNTDMEFDPQEQCLAKMVRFMRRHPDCGLSGCRLYRRDGSYRYPARRFPGLRVAAGRRTPLAPCFQRAVDRYLYKECPPTGVFDCDWLSGCFMLVRREAYEQVGGLDCGFKKYYEDVDYCLRMARAGWRVMFNGKTYCYHAEQGASRNLFSRDALLHAKSYFRWLAKWGPTPRRSLQTARTA